MNGLGVLAKDVMLARCEPNHTGKNTVEKQPGENKMYPNKDFDCVPPEEVDYRYEWRTKDGRVIPYHQMTTTHLENTYNMLERNLCDFINRCANRNEEMDAPDWVETAMDAIADELGRRELKYAAKIKREEDERY